MYVLAPAIAHPINGQRRYKPSHLASVAPGAALRAHCPDPRHDAPTMEQLIVKPNGSQIARVGPADWFSGSVRLEPLFQAVEPSRVSAALVTFEPGARTAWHLHPLGQNLVVTAGCGLTQCRDGRVFTIRPGDAIWCPPNVEHWHGATPTTALSHIAIQEALDGKSVEWHEKLTETEYAAAAAAAIAQPG